MTTDAKFSIFQTFFHFHALPVSMPYWIIVHGHPGEMLTDWAPLGGFTSVPNVSHLEKAALTVSRWSPRA